MDYTGFDIKTANCINKQLEIMTKLYPEIDTINYIGIKDNIYRKFKAFTVKEIKDIYMLSKFEYREIFKIFSELYDNTDIDDSFALSLEGVQDFHGIWFNKFWVSNYMRLCLQLKKCVIDKYAVVGGSTFESIITHEFAHHIYAFLLNNNIDNFINVIWEDLNGTHKYDIQDYLEKNLSYYASTDKEEFFCEAIREYYHNPKPRFIAMQIGNELENTFELYRKNRKNKV